MGEMEVPADALDGAQTQRAVHNFPISGRRSSRATSWPSRWSRQPRRRNAALGVGTHEQARAIVAAADATSAASTTASSRSTSTRPARALSTNMNANEVIATPAGRAGGRGPPQRPRQRLPELQRHGPHRIHVGRGRRRGGADPRADRLHGAGGQGEGVRRRRQDRPDAPDGRDARSGSARSSAATRRQVRGGIRRLRRRPATSCSSCPSAERRSGPASTPRPGSRRRPSSTSRS